MKEVHFGKEIIAGRVIIDLLLVFFVLLTPWWFYISLIVIFIFFFPKYYEAVILGFIIDSLYGSLFIFDPFPFFTLGTAFLLVISIYSRGRIMR